MSTYTVLHSTPCAPGVEYVDVRVEFAAQAFDQLLIVAPTEAAPLGVVLQAYADEYEAAWVPAPPPEDPLP